jgi:hypothetical protein
LLIFRAINAISPAGAQHARLAAIVLVLRPLGLDVAFNGVSDSAVCAK